MQPSRRPGPRRTAGHNGCGHPESSRVTGYVPPRDGILLVSASLTEARHDLAVVHCARQVRDARLVHRVCGHDADLVQVDVLYLLNPVLPFPSMPQFLGGMTMRCGEPDTLPYVSAAATYINQSGGHAGGEGSTFVDLCSRINPIRAGVGGPRPRLLCATWPYSAIETLRSVYCRDGPVIDQCVVMVVWRKCY